METQLFPSSYIWLAYIFEASYSTMVTSVSKKIKCRPIRTREIDGVSLLGVLNICNTCGLSASSAKKQGKFFNLCKPTRNPFWLPVLIQRFLNHVLIMWGCSSYITSLYFFRPSKAMKHVTSRVSVGKFKTK